MQRGAACPETVNKAFAKRQKMDHSVVCNPYRENRPKPVKLLHTGAVDRSPPRGCATLRQSGMTPPAPHARIRFWLPTRLHTGGGQIEPQS